MFDDLRPLLDQTSHGESGDDRLLRLNEVLKLIPVSKSSWWKGIGAGIYPEPVKIGLRSVAWRYRDIKQLLEHGISLDNRNNQGAVMNVVRTLVEGRSQECRRGGSKLGSN